MRTFLLAVATSLCLGCTTLADVSSGQTGCSPEEVAVTNKKSTWSASTWTATCRGVTYHCSAHGGGEGSTAQISCTPQPGEATPGGSNASPPEPATPAGCGFDTQCKGDRVCEAGKCVSPAPPATPAEPSSTTMADPFETHESAAPTAPPAPST